MESRETATAEQRWFANPTAIALLSLVISVLTGIVPLGGYFMNKQDEREKRSIMEVDRLHDPPFSVSLSKVLNHGYDFIEKGKGNVRRDPKVRFEDFWATATDTDADMLLIMSRMKSIGQCLDTRDCDRDEVFSRFPETIYQAIFFLRDYVFVNPKLEAESQGPGLEGWWFGNGVYDFLADYCVWATREFGGMNLWSVKHERLARPGQPLPNPCLPPRDEAPRP